MKPRISRSTDFWGNKWWLCQRGFGDWASYVADTPAKAYAGWAEAISQ